MADKLTPQQQMAVDNRGGKLLVSAAAGSGKTKVLVDRLMKYILDPVDPANIDDFLIITYTRAAASELRGKIAAKLSELIAENPENRHLQRQLQRLYLAKISTVHSFCSDILREYAYRLDIAADFYMAEAPECASLRQRAMDGVLEEAYAQIHADACLRAFVDTQGAGRSDSMVPGIIEKIYEKARCHLDPERWLDQCIEDAKVEGLTDAGQTRWGRVLMDALFDWLELQAQVFERCAREADSMIGQAKPAACLRESARQLRFLKESATWDEVVARKSVDFGRLTFAPKTDDHSISDPIRLVIGECKKSFKKRMALFSGSSAQILSELESSAAAAQGLIVLVKKFGEAFESLKRSRRMLDFGDLEHKTLDLLLGRRRSGPTAVAVEIGQRFREIMVDEYQDSNAVQDAIFSALTAQRQNLFMVGDVKQAIYRFRLADPGIFLEKYSEYEDAASAQPGQGRKVLLSSNFRSGGGVIQAVNDVFTQCMTPKVGGLTYGPEEALREGVSHIPLEEPEVVLHCIDVAEDTYGEEAAFVAEQISSLIDGTHMVRQGDALRPITLDDITILLRSPGSVGIEFRRALEQRGIRTLTDNGIDLLQTQEIGTLRCLLQTISNPRQDIPLLSVLASPIFGFTADELAVVRKRNKTCFIYEALQSCDMPKAAAFLEVLSEMRYAARMHTLPRLLETIFRLTKMEAIYGAMEDGQSRTANLQAFFQIASNFHGGDLEQFLDHLTASEEKGLMIPGAESSSCVRITSIHRSKGLEYPVVFLCGLSRQFNTQDHYDRVLCHQKLGLGLNCVDEENRVRYPTLSKHAIVSEMEQEDISEELRILYVAMTRARDRLIMTYASGSLEKDLQELAAKKTLMGRDLMIREASCLGDWVLFCAMGRTEAGALFALGGTPAEVSVSKIPWKITVEKAPVSQTQLPREEERPAHPKIPTGALKEMEKALSFRYAHSAATQAPSKQTATQRKGRDKDEEAAEYAGRTEKVYHSWRKPSFLPETVQGKEYGNAIHSVLQYIRYEACTDESAVKEEIRRLVEEQFITPQHGTLASPQKIAGFFATELGVKLRTEKNVLREFKFSILDDGQQYASGLQGEKVLLQGVVDCALVEEDGITVVDFKTDYVTEETLEAVTGRYRVQVETYAHALGRIFQKPIKGKTLYLFHLDRFVWL